MTDPEPNPMARYVDVWTYAPTLVEGDKSKKAPPKVVGWASSLASTPAEARQFAAAILAAADQADKLNEATHD